MTKPRKAANGGECYKGILSAAEAIACGELCKDFPLEVSGEMGRLAEILSTIRNGMLNIQVEAKYGTQRIPQASHDLTGINEATLDATNRVLELSEKVLNNQEEMAALLSDLKAALGDSCGCACDRMESLLEEGRESLVSIMAALSFQDMAGQKIKKIIALVKDIETRLLHILLSLGAKVEGREEGAYPKKTEMLKKLEETEEDPNLKQDVVDSIFGELGL